MEAHVKNIVYKDAHIMHKAIQTIIQTTKPKFFGLFNNTMRPSKYVKSLN